MGQEELEDGNNDEGQGEAQGWSGLSGDKRQSGVVHIAVEEAKVIRVGRDSEVNIVVETELW